MNSKTHCVPGNSVHMQVHMHAHTNTRTHTQTQAHTHKYTRAHKHTHAHTHTPVYCNTAIMSPYLRSYTEIPTAFPPGVARVLLLINPNSSSVSSTECLPVFCRS